MDDLDLIKMRLSRTPDSALYRLSKDSGVPYGTLSHIKKKNTKSPTYRTVKKLAAYYKARAA